jgi:hypothetical protein
MQYTIEINGTSVSASQLNMVLTIDKTLDYGSFVVRNTVAEPYSVGDMVDIDITDGVDTKSYHFIVSADDVTKLPNGKYLHAVDIIELTKILEWQTETTRTFTQPTNQSDLLTLLDVVIRLQFTAPIEETSNLENTRIFAIDNDWLMSYELLPHLSSCSTTKTSKKSWWKCSTTSMPFLD